VAAAGERTGGDARNRDYAAAHVTVEGVPDDLVALAYDPQTAGGLLVAVAARHAPALESAFSASKQPLARIGLVESGAGVRLR
jgi:selenide,water dikinase